MIAPASPDRILALAEEINLHSTLLGKDEGAFGTIPEPPLTYACSEAGFLRVVSWLYVLYFEAGKTSIDFLMEYFSIYDLDKDQASNFHYRIVHDLRTFLQHGLQDGFSHDKTILNNSQQWFLSNCRASDPTSDAEWNQCLTGLLQDSIQLMEKLLEAIQRIGEDEFREAILTDWAFRSSRYRPPHDFDHLIQIAATDLGQGQIDAIKLRKKYYESWIKELEQIRADSIFEVEARKLIERALLSTPLLPITGEDIIREFDIPPGPEVGKILKDARFLYEQDPCTRSKLLEKLRSKLAAQ